MGQLTEAAMEIKNALIYGAGMMGKGIALVLSSCEDISVTLFDIAELDVHTHSGKP